MSARWFGDGTRFHRKGFCDTLYVFEVSASEFTPGFCCDPGFAFLSCLLGFFSCCCILCRNLRQQLTAAPSRAGASEGRSCDSERSELWRAACSAEAAPGELLNPVVLQDLFLAAVNHAVAELHRLLCCGTAIQFVEPTKGGQCPAID